MSEHKARPNIAAALGQIERQFGSKVFVNDKENPIHAISTGSPSLNDAIGVGGYPYGSIIEIFGPPSGGKTTVCLEAVHEAQKAGKICAWIDSDKAFSATYAKSIGINLDDLLLFDPITGEEALEISRILSETAEVGLIIIDSVATLVPQADLNTTMGESIAGVQARMMSEALRKLIDATKRNNVIIIFTNQIRFKLAAYDGDKVTERTTGGEALKSYAKLRIEIRPDKPVEELQEDEDITSTARVLVNKVTGKVRDRVKLHIGYGEGFDKSKDYVILAVKKGIIKTSIVEREVDGIKQKFHGDFTMNGENLGKNLVEAIAFLKSSQEHCKHLAEEFKRLGITDHPLSATDGNQSAANDSQEQPLPDNQNTSEQPDC